MLRDRLEKYRAKRDFRETPEPAGPRKQRGKGRRYLIQKHDATRVHYDFRLEHNGVLLSWAIPKGPSLDPADKRLAVHVEDHPLEYGGFEGTIPNGQYGGGTVMLWDRGSWEPHGDVDEGLKQGMLKFALHGERLKGNWALIRLRGRRPADRGKDNWLLIKEKDREVRAGNPSIVDREMTSVVSGREMEEIAHGSDVWRSNRPGSGTTKAKFGRAAGLKKKSKTGAVKIPPFVEPQLATLVDAPPSGGDWVHEIKYDGYRAVTSMAGGSVIIRTRNGLDWTNRFRPLVGPLSELSCDSALLDGEIAVADSQGHTSFGALQAALSEGHGAFGYYLFDLLHLDGEDLRKRPLMERKKLLEKLLVGARKGPLFYSSHLKGEGRQVFQHACDLKLEGIISKRARDPYRSGRTKSWLKTKCGMEQEFVIVGWQPSDKPLRPFRSILLAVREENELRYVGRVGSGYSEARLDELATLFKKHARKDAPVANVPRAFAKHARWLEPVLVAQVALRGWTHDGMVRQGSFKGLREDKPARLIVREVVMPKAEAVKIASAGKDEIAGVRITHPDREMFAGEGITKRDIIEYYVKAADRMLPFIEGRPLALVRCPDGTAKQCFFQKHASPGWPDLFGKIRIREKSGSDEYLYVDDVRGLVGAAQMSVLELHILGARVDAVEKPDRMVFDLDPDEGLAFAKVKAAAKDVRDRLKKIGLESFPMMTGGKGIHVVVPLERKHTWDQHRAFAEALARVMAEEEPERFVANMAKAKRRGKIFIDYLRNQRGSTAIAPFSTRARKGAFVALPVSWQGLAKLASAHPTDIRSAAKLIGGKDPWAGYGKVKQSLPLTRKR